MTEPIECYMTIEQDEKYFRLVMNWGTHKLHSEKLNLDTAGELYTNFCKLNGVIIK